MTKISSTGLAAAVVTGVLAIGCGSSQEPPATAADATAPSSAETMPRFNLKNIRLRAPSAGACEAGTHECPIAADGGEQIACVPDSTAGCPAN